MSSQIRYSVITDKNPREILMLRGTGCRWRRCRFCDYHLDSSPDEEENFRINLLELQKVTGCFHVLEVINSGSFTDLDAQTLKAIEDVCLDKGIRQLHFETHWIHRREIVHWKAHFAGLGIQLKIKMGVETFDPVFRREVMNKGMGDATPEEIADYADEVCLLFGLTGQTEASMRQDIETGLSYFDRVCINIMVENTTEVKPDSSVIQIFTRKLYHDYIHNPRVDILLHNTDFGVGGNENSGNKGEKHDE